METQMTESYTERFFTKRSLDSLMSALSTHYPQLDAERFNELIHDSTWEALAIKGRMRHVTECMHKVLPDSFEEAVDILLRAAPEISGWEGMTLPDYVEVYGQGSWDKAMAALTEFTRYSSSEFAIRPFLISEPERTAEFLERLADDENEDVRRFASEGCRPRHPWAMALPLFKRDPSLILPILEKLKSDESEYVRRSVANNLNDISKDNPDIVLAIAERWIGQSPNTDWLVKHACRTLLKAGNRRALTVFGYGSAENMRVADFQLDKETITLGEKLAFTFSLDLTTAEEAKVRLEYGIYYMKANGTHSRKVWKISEKAYQPGSHTISKTHKFIDRTTRKHYQGTHCISIIVNGEEKAKREFMLEK
jgi:3-methyladenine DNA glycosylase AlkC